MHKAQDPAKRLRALHDEHVAAVLSYVTRRTADPDDAADVLAETFLVTWRRLDDVPTGSEARPWLLAVARRSLANHQRGVRRRRGLVAKATAELARSIAVAPQTTPDTPNGNVKSALSRLRSSDREHLLLWALDGLRHDEIATVLGISPQASRVRLHRARSRLTEALDSQLAPEDSPRQIAGHRDRPSFRTDKERSS